MLFNSTNLEFPSGDLTAKVSELLLATADASDVLIDNSVRDRMNVDVVFVSEFTEGQRVLRHVNTAPNNAIMAVGGADPLKSNWCQRVVDERLP